jgi:hypothetical protein
MMTYLDNLAAWQLSASRVADAAALSRRGEHDPNTAFSCPKSAQLNDQYDNFTQLSCQHQPCIPLGRATVKTTNVCNSSKCYSQLLSVIQTLNLFDTSQSNRSVTLTACACELAINSTAALAQLLSALFSHGQPYHYCNI